MINQSCILVINPTWSWFINILKLCWIPFLLVSIILILLYYIIQYIILYNNIVSIVFIYEVIFFMGSPQIILMLTFIRSNQLTISPGVIFGRQSVSFHNSFHLSYLVGWHKVSFLYSLFIFFLICSIRNDVLSVIHDFNNLSLFYALWDFSKGSRFGLSFKASTFDFGDIMSRFYLLVYIFPF